MLAAGLKKNRKNAVNFDADFNFYSVIDGQRRTLIHKIQAVLSLPNKGISLSKWVISTAGCPKSGEKGHAGRRAGCKDDLLPGKMGTLAGH